MTELILGTAQFGTAYGATNALGRLDESAVKSVLGLANDAGIDTFDTAADYGDSQGRLGRLSAVGRRYITKFSLPPDGQSVDPGSIYRDSKNALRAQTLAGVLFHRASDLADQRGLAAIEVLREGRDSGEIERIGVSIYDSADLDLTISRFPDLDLLQIPANIVDVRLLDDPRIADLRSRGIEIHVRSVFLQGILLADASSLPKFFSPLALALEKMSDFARQNDTSVLGVVLRFVRDHGSTSGVIVGATSEAELKEILDQWNARGPSIEFLGKDLPTELLDPRTWPARNKS